MLRDARDASVGGVLEADVCIVGGGPAALTLAGELQRPHLRIILLETGGETSAESELNEGTVDSPQGYPEHVLVEGRRRQVGGTANLWNHQPRGQRDKFIRCVPLDEMDFEKRAWVPNSGWPFSRTDLDPFYERAQKIFGLGKFEYAANGWMDDDPRSRPLEASDLRSSISQFALPGDFLRNTLGRLRGSETVSILTHATLLSLECDSQSDRITSAEAISPQGKKFRIKATTFVLAAGGLENPRILLLNHAAQEGGLGNQNDQVGRYFMDHPSITLGTLLPQSTALFESASFYDQHLVNDRPIMGKFQLRPELARKEELLNLYSVLVPRFRNLRSNLPFIFLELLAKSPQFLANRCRRSGNTVGAQPSPGSMRQRLLEGYFSECYCGWSRLSNKAARFGEFALRSLVELSPDATNRVTLGNDEDRLGQRKIKIVWHWNELDLRSIRRTQELFQSEMRRAGIGEFSPIPEGQDGVPRTFFSTHHFMGTTRMHHDPKHGVVDANGRVHGWKNLFVAGSSVFPTGGCANPTLTIVALALRLADHLKRETESSVAIKLAAQ